MFANTQMGGEDLASPDVILVQPPAPGPPIPTPMLNGAFGVSAVAFCPKVLLVGAPAHTLTTNIPVSQELPPAPPGIGQFSGTYLGKCSHMTSSVKVKWVGVPATRLSSSTSQNMGNCMGARVAPSQPKVKLVG